MSDSTVYASAELGSELRGEDPGEHVRSFAGLVDDPETIRLLNYYDSLLDDSVQETRIGKEILSNVATTTIDSAVRNGAVSHMKAATGLTGQDRDGGDLFAEAAERLSHEGSVGLVFGPPGAGKTALTIDVARSWQVRTGGAMIGNTSWDGFDEQIDSDTEMFEAMGSRQGPVLAVIDEAAQDLSGFGSSSKAAEEFSDRLLWIRKREQRHGRYAKQGSVLVVSHTRVKTAKSIRRVASFGISKPKRSKPDLARLLDSEGDKDDWEQVASYQGITDSAETYPTHEPSGFSIEAGAEDQDDDDENGLENADQIERVLQATQDKDMTHEEAADFCDFSRHWVGDKVGEWRAGEYRELFRDPEDSQPE